MFTDDHLIRLDFTTLNMPAPITEGDEETPATPTRAFLDSPMDCSFPSTPIIAPSVPPTADENCVVATTPVSKDSAGESRLFAKRLQKRLVDKDEKDLVQMLKCELGEAKNFVECAKTELKEKDRDLEEYSRRIDALKKETRTLTQEKLDLIESFTSQSKAMWEEYNKMKMELGVAQNEVFICKHEHEKVLGECHRLTLTNHQLVSKNQEMENDKTSAAVDPLIKNFQEMQVKEGGDTTQNVHAAQNVQTELQYYKKKRDTFLNEISKLQDNLDGFAENHKIMCEGLSEMSSTLSKWKKGGSKDF